MLKPEVSIPVALGTAGAVIAIYQLALPPLTDTKATEPNHPILAGSERTALWTSIGVTAGVSLVAHDPMPFIFGGLLAVGLSWMHRHARAFDPASGQPTTAQATVYTGDRGDLHGAGLAAA